MKTLTQNSVIEHGWDKLSVITADMIEKYRYTQIGKNAFNHCHSLTSITIPNSVTTIGLYAFYDCTNLTLITIPNSVTKIGDYAFYNCRSLTSITIPNSVIAIGCWTFYRCNNLTSITIPNSVTYIGNGAFYHCSNLTSIIIPNSVTTIEDDAFADCGINLPKKYDNQGRLIAYKGFDKHMQCRGFQYIEGETYETDKAKLCVCGFHACTNPLDIFNYYAGEINNKMFIHEVYLEDVSGEEKNDSKVVSKKITIGRRLTIEDINNILQDERVNTRQCNQTWME